MAALADHEEALSVEGRVRRIVFDILAAEPERSVDEAYLVQDLGADSLDLVEIESELETEFAITFAPDDSSKLNRCITVGDVAQLMRRMLAARLSHAEGR